MCRKLAADVFTLRPRQENLLPRITLLLYAPSANGLLSTLKRVAEQADREWEIMLLLDGHFLRDEDLHGLLWPDDVSLLAMETEYPCGKSYCINLALKLVESDFLICAEAGDLVHLPECNRMADHLETADNHVVGLCGSMEWLCQNKDGRLQQQTMRGISSRQISQFFARLHTQEPIAPPLVRTSAVQEIGGYPTDFPGEGFQLADTAFLLALFKAGLLDEHPASCLIRPKRTLPAQEETDAKKLLQVLLRQTLKQLHLPLYLARPS